MSVKMGKIQAEMYFHNRSKKAELKSHYTVVQCDTTVS